MEQHRAVEEETAAGVHGPTGTPRWLVWCVGLLLAWCLLLALWTLALLTPDPVRIAKQVLPGDLEFSAAKLTHVLAYGLLAAMIGVLRPLGRWRWLFLALLSLHGMGTEYLQTFVPTRTGSLRDVGIDHVGILLGAVLTWKNWLRRG
jgi:VanZ family protein